MKVRTVSFGKYYSVYGVPCIEIIISEEDMKPRTYYLSAFRNYKFQVSGTYEGVRTLGDTPVFGLKTLTTIHQEGSSNLNNQDTIRYIISTIALDAVHDLAHNYMLNCDDDGNRLEVAWDFPDSHDSTLSYKRNEEWVKFVDNTYNFAAGKEVENVPYK